MRLRWLAVLAMFHHSTALDTLPVFTYFDTSEAVKEAAAEYGKSGIRKS